MTDGNQPRWSTEQAFFDGQQYSEGPLPRNTVERYLLCRHPFTPAEYPFWALGDVRGKRILELGCGDGVNSVLLALKGASVVGVDISPRAIAIARNRACLHRVETRAEFHVSPVEVYLERADEGFDVICGFAVLHHLLPVLDSVLSDLRRLARPEAACLFAEPVALSAWLRKLRLLLPVPVRGTAGEHPLSARDLVVIRRRLPGVEVRLFDFLLRFWSRLVTGRYEEYPPLRRAVYHLLCHADRGILSIPGSGILASSAVILWRRR